LLEILVRSLLRSSVVLLVALATVVPLSAADSGKPAAGQSRTFLFTYSATVTGLTPGAKARIWLPVPPSNEDQEVKVEKQDLPGETKVETESEYGNKIWYVEGKAAADGTLPLSIVYRVTRREVKGESGSKDDSVKRFLKPDRLVPVAGKPIEQIVSKLAGLKDKELPKDQTAAAKMFYEAVNDHMKYSKEGTGWGRGDSVWACDSKYGNCTDFHSLFISLARANKIPAKFEIGFGLPEKRGSGEVGGYHCWAKFRPEGKNWIPVDISEANKNPAKRDYYFGNLTEDRVAFSTGRDITLTPKQDGEPLNFFVYPYVEVDGKPYPADKVQKKFRYEDVK
jgi:transglutaminase-like putative cysteine protease